MEGPSVYVWDRRCWLSWRRTAGSIRTCRKAKQRTIVFFFTETSVSPFTVHCTAITHRHWRQSSKHNHRCVCVYWPLMYPLGCRVSCAFGSPNPIVPVRSWPRTSRFPPLVKCLKNVITANVLNTFSSVRYGVTFCFTGAESHGIQSVLSLLVGVGRACHLRCPADWNIFRWHVES